MVHTLARYYDGTFADRVAALGASGILRCTDTGDIIGGGVEAGEIRGTAYELLRAIAGRRTRTEAKYRRTITFRTCLVDDRHLRRLGIAGLVEVRTRIPSFGRPSSEAADLGDYRVLDMGRSRTAAPFGSLGYGARVMGRVEIWRW